MDIEVGKFYLAENNHIVKVVGQLNNRYQVYGPFYHHYFVDKNGIAENNEYNNDLMKEINKALIYQRIYELLDEIRNINRVLSYE